MSSSRTPKTVTPVPAAAYLTDRKLKAIENKLKTVTEDMIKIGDELKRAEMREREHHEVCNIILRNQTRIETKIDLLLGKEIPKPSDSHADFVMSSLVPNTEATTKDYLDQQTNNETGRIVDLKILTTFGLFNALKDISPFVHVPDFITEEYEGELLILIKQPETTIPASVAVEKIQQFMTGQQENGFSGRYRILPSDAKIIVSYEGKRIRLNRLGDYLKYKEKFASFNESESEKTRSFSDLFIFDFNSRDGNPLMREQKEKVEEKPVEFTVSKLIAILENENPYKGMLNLRPVLTTDNRVFLIPDFTKINRPVARLEFSDRLSDLISVLKTVKDENAAREYLSRPVFIHDPAAHTAGPVFIPLTSTESLFFKS